MMKRLFLLVILVLLSSTLHATPQNKVLIVTDSLTGPHQDVLNALQDALFPNYILTITSSSDAQIRKQLSTTPENFQALITIGNKGLKWLDNYPANKPSLSLLISRAAFSQLKDIEQKSLASAIYTEQPLKRIANIINKGLGNINKATVLISQDNTKMYQAIDKPINVEIESISPSDNWIQQIRTITQSTQALIALPDTEIYNNKTIKNILITAYKDRVPLIGYSQGFTRAGALFSIYTPLQSLGTEAGRWLSNNTPVTRRSSDFYTIDFNENVARSLKVQIKDTDWLDERLWESNSE